MKKLVGIIAAGLAAIPVIAFAVPAPKYFVCKYVGKPGVDERLQTGQNPISVSGNALTSPVVGAYFNDAQGRSLVLAEDTGQDEPDCPVPVNTNPPLVVTETPKTETANPTAPAVNTPAEVPGNVESLPENK